MARPPVILLRLAGNPPDDLVAGTAFHARAKAPKHLRGVRYQRTEEPHVKSVHIELQPSAIERLPSL